VGLFFGRLSFGEAVQSLVICRRIPASVARLSHAFHLTFNTGDVYIRASRAECLR